MNMVSAQGKYYLAKQIHDGFGRFEAIQKRDKNGKLLVASGDIVCFGTGHVEIVTSVHVNKYSDDDFCSRGAGRSDGTNGKEKCGSFFDGTRDIDDNDIVFIRIV